MRVTNPSRKASLSPFPSRARSNGTKPTHTKKLKSNMGKLRKRMIPLKTAGTKVLWVIQPFYQREDDPGLSSDESKMESAKHQSLSPTADLVLALPKTQ